MNNNDNKFPSPMGNEVGLIESQFVVMGVLIIVSVPYGE